jgi:glucose/arabinose dehydrogenase
MVSLNEAAAQMGRYLIKASLLPALSACGASIADQSATERPFKASEVARFDSPWAMSFLPGSGMPFTNMALVTEKGGKLWLVDTASGRKEEVAGVPPVHVEGQGGLLDVLASPDFAGNQQVFISYSKDGPNGSSYTVVDAGRLILGHGQPHLEGLRTWWNAGPAVNGGSHYAGRLAISPDGQYLFMSFGERFQFDPAQRLDNNIGKTIRLTTNHAIPEDNPFEVPRVQSAPPDRNPGIWTYGHRNPLGLAFAPDGRLWEIEMGPMGGDELNLIQRGWPRASNGSNYDGSDIPDHKQGDGFEPPKVWWNPSVSPAGLIIYSGDLFPEWKGDALIGALSGEAFIHVRIRGDQASKADEWAMGQRIRAVDQGPRGEVYLLEDGPGGRLLRLEPKR